MITSISQMAQFPPPILFQNLTLLVVDNNPVVGNISNQPILYELVLDNLNWIELQQQSPVFRGLFEYIDEDPNNEGQPIIRIFESERQGFMDLLEFVDHQDLTTLSDNRLICLQFVADKYACVDCLHFCTTQLIQRPMSYDISRMYLDPPCFFDTCCDLRDNHKIELARYYFSLNYRDVERHWQDVLNLSPALFDVVLMSDLLEVEDEDRLFDLCMEAEATQKKNLVDQIRWPYLTMNKLLEVKKMPPGNNLSDKLKDAISYHVDSPKLNQTVFRNFDSFKEMPSLKLYNFVWYKHNGGIEYIEREYKARPVRVVERDGSDESNVYFQLHRKNFVKLLSGETIDSQKFHVFSTRNVFHLSSHCVNIEGEDYYGLYLRGDENENQQTVFKCNFFVFSQKDFKSKNNVDGCILKFKGKFRRTSTVGTDNFLGLRWNELVSQQSEYFLLNTMYIRVLLKSGTEASVSTEEAFPDKIIKRLRGLETGAVPQQVLLTDVEIQQLCNAASEILLSQPTILPLKTPLNICGDIHGQYSDLHKLFEHGGYPPSANYLFLGNYVNCGNQSIETICLLLAYKIKYKDHFFLLRGSHECASMSRKYGFYDECKRRVGVRIWEIFIQCFNCLPVAALIDGKILCMHGGLSPELEDLNQIKEIVRPADVPDQGLVHDLLWADPNGDIKGWAKNEGVSTFGADRVIEFLQKNNLDLICRAHQVVEAGYEFFARNKLLTLFSAPSYCMFDNAGAMLSLNQKLECTFKTLKASKKKKLGSGINIQKPATPHHKGGKR